MCLQKLSKEQWDEISKLAKIELAKKSYLQYVTHVHRGLWYAGKHLVHLCSNVESLLNGTLKNELGNDVQILLVSMPPQHGKSQAITESLPSWYLGKYPNKRVIIVSYNTEFATRFGRRNINKINEFGKDIFGITLSKETSDNFELSGNTGSCICRGIMSGVTGNPGDLIIIDDPIKNREEADSETYRSKMWDEYLNSIKTRLSANGKIIVIQTRWHEDDLAGRIIAQEGHKCKVLNFPCEAEDNDILGRKRGDALFPEIGKDNEWLKDFKLSYMTQEGSRAWQALFQGRPTALEGGLLKREWWRFYDRLPDKFDRVCQSWDCAFKDSDTSDYVVGQVWGMIGIDCYLIDQIRGRMNFPTTLDAIEATKDRYPQTQRIFIEDKANGSAIISILQNKISGVIPVNPEGGKVSRVSAISPHIESGHVYLPKYAAYLNDFLSEASAFPNGAHDDQCFIAGTKIATLFGDKNIEDIKIGDMVITPFGIRKVLDAGCTGYREIIKFKGTGCTPNHPYFTFENGFIRVDSLTQALNNDTITLGGVLKWRYKKLLSSTELNIDLWGREGIILVSQTQMKEENMPKDFMWQFGNFIISEQYQVATRFIIKMATISIMTLITWNVYQGGNIVRLVKSKILKNKKNILNKLENYLKNGMLVKKVINGIKTTIKKVLDKYSLKNINVNSARLNLKQNIITQDFVPITVQKNIDIERTVNQLQNNVLYVGLNLNQNQHLDIKKEKKLAVENVVDYLTGRIEKVYNITVDKDHVYYADGLLVSNCDAMSQAINRMMYYKNQEKPQTPYVQGGTYCRKELQAKGFRDYEINSMVKQGKIKLIGR